MLSKIVELLSQPSRFQIPPDPLLRFAKSGWAKAATPDDLIGAHLAQLFVTEFDEWSIIGAISKIDKLGRFKLPNSDDKWVPERMTTHHYKNQNYCWRLYASFDLRHSARDITLIYRVERAARDCDSSPPYIYYGGQFTVKDVVLNTETSLALIAVWIAVEERVETAKVVAAKALKEMEDNEKKWNLAETLLGMKRDENGALVPAKPAEPPEPPEPPAYHVHDADCEYEKCCHGTLNVAFDDLPKVERKKRRVRPKKDVGDSVFDAALEA